MKKLIYILIFLVLTSCAGSKHYVTTNITGEYIPITTAQNPDKNMEAFVSEYKVQLDKEMNQVIGTSNQYMTTGVPESLLTNLVTDVMLLVDSQYTDNNKIDAAFMNVHGIRAPIADGDITLGDIYSAFPFDNTLTFLKIKGKYLKDIFASIAKFEMVGVSSNIKIEIKDKQVITSQINNKPIEDEKIYTVITLDYLADGNDTMDAFKKAEMIKPTGIKLREYMLDYVKGLTVQNKNLVAKLDGRISIIK